MFENGYMTLVCKLIFISPKYIEVHEIYNAILQFVFCMHLLLIKLWPFN